MNLRRSCTLVYHAGKNAFKKYINFDMAILDKSFSYPFVPSSSKISASRGGVPGKSGGGRGDSAGLFNMCLK